jgi:hypothetical protein
METNQYLEVLRQPVAVVAASQAMAPLLAWGNQEDRAVGVDMDLRLPRTPQVEQVILHQLHHHKEILAAAD